MDRNKQVSRLDESKKWDLIVIGGGASGLGVALDAASRGFQTLLLESHDFSKGTSSRSTKLVHGGVRYLAQGDVRLVREALRERGLLAKNASHLFKNQAFVIPNYTWWGGPYYKFGLWIYDLLSGKLSLGRTKYIGKKETVRRLATIKQKKLASGVVYQDGQFDDSRLAINVAQTIIEKGGCVVNYTEVIDLIKDGDDKVIGVKAKDLHSGKVYDLEAKAVINATGVFTNEIMAMNSDEAEKLVVPSQGIHIVLDRSFLPGDDALMIPKTSDGRVLFAVPWHDKLVVGTTDTLIDSPDFEPVALEKEINFVLDTAKEYLTKPPQREDVLSVFAGLRPLAAPKKDGGNTKEISRSHKVIVHDTELITLTGGKWTTFRQMAEDAVDKAIEVRGLEQKPCVTHQLPIHGNIPHDQVHLENHLYVYGADIPAIQKLMEEKPELKEKLHPKYENTYAEVYWAIHEEMAQTVEDILARRVRLLFMDARAAIDCAESVAQFMARELGKDAAWVKQQSDDFRRLAENYLLVPYSPH